MRLKTITILLIVFIWILFGVSAIWNDIIFDWVYGVVAIILSVVIYVYMREVTYNKNTDRHWDE